MVGLPWWEERLLVGGTFDFILHSAGQQVWCAQLCLPRRVVVTDETRRYELQRQAYTLCTLLNFIESACMGRVHLYKWMAHTLYYSTKL